VGFAIAIPTIADGRQDAKPGHPALRISDLENLTPFRKPQDLARFKKGLRKAGLPE